MRSSAVTTLPSRTSVAWVFVRRLIPAWASRPSKAEQFASPRIGIERGSEVNTSIP